MQFSDLSVTPAIAIVLAVCASMVAVTTFGLCLYCFQRSSDEENDGKEADEKRYINRRSVSVTTPISEEKEESVFWGKFRNWFAQPEEENVPNRGLRNNSSAPALYDKPPMGTMSVSLVQPQPQMIESDVSSTSGKRPSVYSLGARRPSEKARLSSTSFVPTGFKIPLDFETTLDEPTPTTQYLGRLEFSTIYIFAESTLRVRILKAFDLPAMDLTGTSDPFVKCCLLPDRKRKLETKVRRKTLNPTWNETLSFEGLAYEKIQQRVLYLQVMDHDRFSRNDPIGEIYIPLHTINLGEEIITEQMLLPCKGSNKRGELLLSLFYQPIEGIMDVEIEKARNLKPMDIGGTSDPYVKIWLMYRNKRVEKKKTAIKKNSLNPVFGEVFTFSVPMGQLRDIQLEITVMDYDKVGRNDTIGKIYLGHKSTGLEKQHWKDMLSKPKEKLEPGRKPEPPGPVSQWHVLRV